MNGQTSSYLRHLPPALWADEPAPPEFSLGAFLRIFEKVLTGIDDGVTVPHGTHVHPSLASEIARQAIHLDPWKTPEPFLDWLASWVALEFPTLQDLPLWDEYQRRKVTSEIARTYRQRGLTAGLNRYLDLYAVGGTRPRVALDDGSRVLAVTPRPGEVAPVSALVTQGPVVTRDGVRGEGLTRPWRLAAGPDGSVFVGDIGLPSGVPIPIRNRIWRIGGAGHYDLDGTPPKPSPLAPSLALTRVAALAVRAARGGQPETLYVLDRTGRLFAIRAPYLDEAAAQVTSLAVAGATLAPVAMAVDGAGDLLVLDRGDGPGTANPPKVVTVDVDPLAMTRTPLRQVIEPLSLLVEPDGTLLVGDGGAQEPTPGEQLAGNLVRIQRTAGGPWVETPLLPPSNPLVAPTGLARTRNGRLHVLDVGLKPFAPSSTDPFVCPVAEPAGIFSVDLDAAPPSVRSVTRSGQFVYPTGMVANGDRLVVCDPGQPEVAGLQPFWSRVRPFHFDVVIHFTSSRLPEDPARRTQALRQAFGNVRAIVEQQKPAHTHWNAVTAID